MKNYNKPISEQRKSLREERETSMQNLRDTAPHIQSGQVSKTAADIHPSPISAPAMPAEVYYNRMALDMDGVSGFDGFDVAMDGENGI